MSCITRHCLLEMGQSSLVVPKWSLAPQKRWVIFVPVSYWTVIIVYECWEHLLSIVYFCKHLRIYLATLAQYPKTFLRKMCLNFHIGSNGSAIFAETWRGGKIPRSLYYGNWKRPTAGLMVRQKKENAIIKLVLCYLSILKETWYMSAI